MTLAMNLEHSAVVNINEQLGKRLPCGQALRVEVSYNTDYIDKQIRQTPDTDNLHADTIAVVDTIASDIAATIDNYFQFDADELAYFGNDEEKAIASRYTDDGAIEINAGDMQIRVVSPSGIHGGAHTFGEYAARLMHQTVYERICGEEA